MAMIFVYGTLKRGFPNHDAGLTGSRFIGRFRTLEAFPLVVGGQWFSPYLLDEPGQGHRVFGELFEVHDEGLANLDRMEGTHLPRGYRRIGVMVEPAGGGKTMETWTYVKDRAAIDGGVSGPMEEYALDPRYVVPSKRTHEF